LSAALPLLALLLVVLSSLFLQSRERNERSSDLATTLVNTSSATVLLDALNAETSVRGFALTRDATFLQPYHSALSHLHKDEDALRSAALDSASSAPARTILTLVNSEFASLTRVRVLVASGATEEQLLGPLKTGKSIMDRLRARVTDLENLEASKILAGTSQIATLEDGVTAGELVGLLLSIVGGILGALYFSRSVTRRLQIAVRNAHRLGQGDPLEFESPSGDEFDEMDTALRNAELQLLARSREVTSSLKAERASLERSRFSEEVTKVAEVERATAEDARLVAEAGRENVEIQLHQSQRLESLGQLAGGVAHDFNNLLAVILNYASFVVDELTTAATESSDSQWEGVLNDVHQIQVAGERASELTHQLLSFARREVVQARELNLNDAITRMEQILRRTIGEQIELVIDLSERDAIVVADPGQIEQVVLNLVINARDAMPSGGSLSIATAIRRISSDGDPAGVSVGSYVCMRVSDNGAGMSSEVRDRAFEPFFSTKERGERSGLGLATVYGIVMQSGGHTEIYTDEGVGTTISILLPVVAHDPAKPDSDGDQRSHLDLEGTETILVVDDEEALGEMTRRMLVRAGYQVLIAANGAQAIEIAANSDGPIHLLLTDVVMAVMQGPAVAREVRTLRPGVRVLYMSGHAQPVLEAELMLGTEFLLVEKPFDQTILLENIRKVLDDGG
jgi:signal transduction histidine kinase/CHASE3 domain sensor protein